jgi:Flp pilus assembly protein TadG
MQKWISFPTISQRLLRRVRQERGQALVEFAIVLPVLMLIIVGILYFGRYENYSNQVTQLAEEAARFAAVNSPVGAPNLQAYILTQTPGELQTKAGDVTKAVTVYIGCPTGSCAATSTNVNSVTACVTATVSYPSILGIGGATSTLVGRATMLIEASQTVANWTPTAGSAPC